MVSERVSLLAGLVDSHCHVGAREFDDDRRQILHRAAVVGAIPPLISRMLLLPVLPVILEHFPVRT